MAPKPLKTSSPSKNSPSLAARTAAQAMPPPPLPAPPPPPQGLLVAESLALSGCLRSAAVKAGQIYGFYADAKRLGIKRHAPYPPRSLLSSLGRDVEQYDQLCDAMQTHLKHAINVLKRDLAREENRLQREAEEAVAKAAAAAAPPAPPSPAYSPMVPEPPPTSPIEPQTIKTSLGPLRRQSTISLSSLHRPPFPHKLDLSAATLRLNSDDPTVQSGLASPVTLAPKSSIPKVAPDFPFPDIDLTVGDDDSAGIGSMPGSHRNSMSNDPAIGSTADKPIDLDYIDNIFDANPHQGDSIQSGPLNLGAPSASVQVKQEDHQLDLDFLKSLQTDDTSSLKDDILAGLHTTTLEQQSSFGGTDPAHDLLSAIPPDAVPSDIGHLGEESTLLAGLGAAATTGHQDSSNQPAQSTGENYDIDFNNLLTQDMNMDTMDIFNLGVASPEGATDSKPA